MSNTQKPTATDSSGKILGGVSRGGAERSRAGESGVAFPQTSALEWWGHGRPAHAFIVCLQPVCLSDPLQSPPRPDMCRTYRCLPVSWGFGSRTCPSPPQLWNQIHGSSHPSHEMMLDTRPSASTAGLEARLYSPGWLPPLLPACLPHQLTQISFLFLLFKLFSGNKAIFLLPSRQKQRSLNLRKIHVYILWSLLQPHSVMNLIKVRMRFHISFVVVESLSRV